MMGDFLLGLRPASQPASTLRSIFGHEGHLSKEVAREAAQHLPDWWPGAPSQPIPIPREPKTDRSSH